MVTKANDTPALLITPSIERFRNYLLLSTKQTSHSKSIEFIKAGLKCLNKLLLFPTEDIFVSKNLIDSLNFYYNDKSIEINSLLIEIINKIFTETFFDKISDGLNLSVLFLNTILRLTYQSRHLLITELVIRKIHKYINQLLTSTHKQITKSLLFDLHEFEESFPIIHSSYFGTIDKELNQINLIQKCKEDKLQALKTIKSIFKNLTFFSEQYDIIFIYSPSIIKPLLDVNKKQNFDELYQIGLFLQKFLFMNNYILNISLNSNGDVIPKENLILIYDNHITYDLTQFEELNSSVYQCTYEYEILQLYPGIISTYRSYFKIATEFELNFKLQFQCYQLLKALYFIFPSYRIEFEEYIPKTLFVLASFHNVIEWNQTLECREFAYYLLLHDKNINSKIKSATSEPQVDITYFHVLLRDIKIPMGFMRKMSIDSGLIKSKDIEIFEPNSIVFIEVKMIENMDITIKVYFCDTNEPCIQTEIAVAKKINCYNKVIKIVIYAKQIGRYRIDFDNSYAWITMKSLHYRITILKPLKSDSEQKEY